MSKYSKGYFATLKGKTVTFEVVRAFGDIKVEFVNHFGDVKLEKVSHFGDFKAYIK